MTEGLLELLYTTKPARISRFCSVKSDARRHDPELFGEGARPYFNNPARFNKASGLGSLPLNFLYKVIGCSVPPCDKI